MADQLPAPNPDHSEKINRLGPLSDEEIVQILEGYRQEAISARKGGDNPRDDVWKANIDLYWGRFDFSSKAPWQAQESMPEAPMFVDRWAAAMREALTSSGDWYAPVVPGDSEGDIEGIIKRFMNVLLARCGRNQLGQDMEFGGVFEEQMKMGAMTAACAVVTWKESEGGGYVACEFFDPRKIWLDATGRNMYRIRRVEIDKNELLAIAKASDSSGKSLYNVEVIEKMLSSQVDEETKREDERIAGHSKEISTPRQNITLDEYYCTLIDHEGNVLGTKQLCIVANETFLIRGPEDNPFRHGKDWVVYTPMITVPGSVYGKSYMENWSGIAIAFNEMTNLILDAAQTSAMKAFAMVAGMMEDPSDLQDGMHPNKIFLLEDGSDPKRFVEQIDLGSLGPDVITVWQALKAEMREGAAFSEISLGQLPPKGDITATEITESSRGSSALIRSISRTVEIRQLEPTLNLIFHTGLQHLSRGDVEMREAIGVEAFDMLLARKKDFLDKKIAFRVRGISELIDRAQSLRSLLNVVQIMSQSPELLAEFKKKVDVGKLVDEIMRLQNIDIGSLQLSEREKLVESAGAEAQQGEQDQTAAAQQGAVQEQQADIRLKTAKATLAEAQAAGEAAKIEIAKAKVISEQMKLRNEGKKNAGS